MTFATIDPKSIMLEELTSCSMVHTSNPVLLYLAGASLLVGFLTNSNGRSDTLVLFVVVAVILAIVWAVTRRQALSLTTAGATITVNVVGTKLEEIESFIDRTEKVKNDRYFAVRTVG